MTYAMTLVPPSAWTRIPVERRRRAVDTVWWLTEIGLLVGFYDVRGWEAAIAITAVHAAVVFALVGYRFLVFPAQIRLAYLAWIVVGTFVPGMTWMMAVTAVGLLANLTVGYCPLARTLYLLPWNREHALTARQVVQVFTQAPGPGRFVLAR